MNPEEQNGEQDILNFLHSDHDTLFEYNQEKLGSDIHASVSSRFLQSWKSLGLLRRVIVRMKGVCGFNWVIPKVYF